MKQLSMSLLAVAVLVGCHSSVPDLSQVLPADASPAMRELMLAERRWQSVRPQEYEFTVDIQCFCYGIAVRPPRIRVVGQTPTLLDTLPPEGVRFYESFDTIDKLFARIRETLERGEYKVAVVYDPESGYPQTADLDPVELTSDDELSVMVADFQRR